MGHREKSRAFFYYLDFVLYTVIVMTICKIYVMWKKVFGMISEVWKTGKPVLKSWL